MDINTNSEELFVDPNSQDILLLRKDKIKKYKY